MTPAEATWENEGGAYHPDIDVESEIALDAYYASLPGGVKLRFTPAITSALTDCELAIMRQLACEFFGSLQALEDGNLEGLEMAESSTFDYGAVA